MARDLTDRRGAEIDDLCDTVETTEMFDEALSRTGTGETNAGAD